MANDVVQLTDDQERILSELMHGGDYCVSVLGTAGSGKSFMIREYVKRCSEKNMKVIVCAYTGVAASLYDGGMTLHSLLYRLPKDARKALEIKDFRNYLDKKGFGLFHGSDRLTCKQHALLSTKYQEYLDSLGAENDDAFYEFIEKTSVRGKQDFILVIDESSMVPKRMMEMMLRLFVFDKIVLIGDKYQIAPVSQDKGYCYGILPTETLHLEMTQVVRQKDQAMLMALRDVVRGMDQDRNIDFLNAYFRKNFSPFRKEDVRIYYSNAEKDYANAQHLRNTPTVQYYPKVRLLMDWKDIAMGVKWLNHCGSEKELKDEIITHYQASLRANIVTVPANGSVMSLKNQRSSDSRCLLANGHIAELRNARGGKAHEFVNESKMFMEYRYDDVFHYRDETYPVLGATKPFHPSTAPYFLMVYPALQPAYAFTYHKTQGMTVDSPKVIGVYVPEHAIDMSGLMYVALTRCTDFRQINLHGELSAEHFQYNHDFDVDRIIENTIKSMKSVDAA